MSAVAKAKAVFCNEVSADLSIVQEEWQTACSGEWGSYAVKFEDPLILKWRAHMFWVGNGFPKKFKNLQGQVSRRLAGVLMAYPVEGRTAASCRGFCASWGPCNGNRSSHTLSLSGSTVRQIRCRCLPLPPFREYYRKSRRATDPIEDFLSEGTFVRVDPNERMTMSEFKELYSEYRIHYEMGRATRWNEECYRTPFNERGIFVSRDRSNIDIVHGVGKVPRNSDVPQ